MNLRSLPLLVILALSLAACTTPTTGSDDAATPSPTATSSASATPRPTGAATAEPREPEPYETAPFVPTPPDSADEKSDFSDWIITGEGIGPIMIGMTYAEAAALLHEFDGYGTCHVVWTGHTMQFRTWHNEAGIVTGVGVSETVDPALSPRTPEGLTKHSSESEVLQQYPDVAAEESASVGRHIPVPAGDNVIDFLVGGHYVVVHSEEWSMLPPC